MTGAVTPAGGDQPAHERDPLIREPDPELERLLDEECAIEGRNQAMVRVASELCHELNDAVQRWRIDAPFTPRPDDWQLSDELIEGSTVTVRYEVQFKDGRSIDGKFVHEDGDRG